MTTASSRPSAAYDWLIAAGCEGAIVLCIGVVGLLSRNAFIFSSLGATAYEQIEKSRSPSARPYNILVGHFVAVAAGFASVAALHVWKEPVVLSSHQMSAGRVWAAVLAVVITVAVNQRLKATQPAACSTTLLVALGSFSNWDQLALLAGGVLIVAVVGEPLRRIRLHTTSPEMLH